MHFLMTEELVRARAAELRKTARQKNFRRTGTLRCRVGWALVESGLRLVGTTPAVRRIA
jgi:hypothetical protein